MIKNTFLAHFSGTDSQTHSLTHSLTDSQEVGVIELHVAAKKIMLLTGTVPALKNRFLGHFCVTNKLTDKLTNSQTHRQKVCLCMWKGLVVVEHISFTLYSILG